LKIPDTTSRLTKLQEIRYILGGSGYFDVRNKKDQWVRIHIKAGDLMTLPEGIYHRFTVDETDMIHAMRCVPEMHEWIMFALEKLPT